MKLTDTPTQVFGSLQSQVASRRETLDVLHKTTSRARVTLVNGALSRRVFLPGRLHDDCPEIRLAFRKRTHVPIDAAIDLPMEDPVAELGPGDMFGEQAALAALKQDRIRRAKFYPRSASVKAISEVTALEMLPHILNNILYKAPAFTNKLNEAYKSRALDTHLRSVPVFQDVSQEFLDELRAGVGVDRVDGRTQIELACCQVLLQLGIHDR